MSSFPDLRTKYRFRLPPLRAGRSLMLLFTSLVLAGCSTAPPPKKRMTDEELVDRAKQGYLKTIHSSPDGQKRDEAFNRHKVTANSVFTSSTRIEGYRLVTKTSEKILGKVHDLPYYAVSKPLPLKFVSDLREIVMTPENYSFPGSATKPCSIDPGVAFRVWKGAKFVDLILCFECNELVVFEYDKKIPESTIGSRLTGRYYVAGDFDKVRPQLVELVKQAFPNDPILSIL